jgi:hypothetical protein
MVPEQPSAAAPVNSARILSFWFIPDLRMRRTPYLAIK